MTTETTGLFVPPSLILPPGVVPQRDAAPPAKDNGIPTIDLTPKADVQTESLVDNPATPKPRGWKILCAVPKLGKTFENSIIQRAESYVQQEEHATAVLWVVALGSEAYKDKAKFPDGPWCKVGDFVMVRMYSGTRFKVFEQEFRLINDDMVEAVVDDPRGVGRA